MPRERFFEESGHIPARALLDRDEAFIAPSLLLAEIANAAWKRLRRGDIAREAADDVIGLMARPFLVLAPIEGLAAEAARMALDLKHPIYDCFYLALAIRESAPFATADRKLAALAERVGVGAELLR